MPLYDNQGNPVEGALTADEVEAKLTEATNRAKQEAESEFQQREAELKGKFDGINETIESLKQEIAAKEEEVATTTEASRKKSENLAALRKKLESKEDDASGIDEKISGLRDELYSERKNKLRDQLTNGNKELNDKVDVYLKKLNPDYSNPDELEMAVKQAYVLANDDSVNTAGNVAGTGSGAAPSTDDLLSDTFSEKQKLLCQEFGIDEGTLKKYKNGVKSYNYARE